MSIKDGVIALAVFTATAVIGTLFLRFAWEGWTLFAYIWAAFYFVGGLGMMPWASVNKKTFSLGVFVATLMTSIEFFEKLQAT